MKKRFTEEQIIKVLNEFRNGKSAKDLGREYGTKGYYKKVLQPGVKREVVRHIIENFGLSIRKFCKLAQLAISHH